MAMKTKRVLAALALGGVLGCGSSNGLPPNQPIQRQLALTAFKDDDCDSLRKYIADTAVLQMKSELELEKKWWNQGWGRGGPVEDGPSAGDTGSPSPQAAGPSSYTTTNTQVAGVDEADFVKNDGTRLFVLSGQRLFVSQSWPADQLSLQSTVDLEGWPREMFLDGNVVTVFSSVYTPYDMQSTPGVAMPVCAGGMDCAYWYGNTTKVTEVDVSDLAHPQVVSEVYLPGEYDTSRMIGNEARVVLYDWFRWPDGVQYWPDNSAQITTQAQWDAAIDMLEAKNAQILESTPLSTWLPDTRRKLADGSVVSVGYKCSDFSRTNAPAEMGIATVASFDMTQPQQDPQRTSLLANVSTVYANADALYLASPHWWWWPEPGQTDYTYLYKFDLSGPKAKFVAGGGVNGVAFSQFALDEYQGKLRIATQVDTLQESPDSPWGTWQTTNQLAVLEQNGSALEQVGSVSDIAKGEWLTSARFDGPRAYLSTYLYTDPFFTFDLSDPAHPRKVGKLKVPGESSYVQPIDDTHVLAIGQDWNTTTDGTVDSSQGIPLQLSLFDVSDLSNPTLVAQTQVGVGYSWSEAEWDHKAFNWYPQKKLLAIPFSDWIPNQTDYWSSFVSDLRVFSVDPATGITAKGALSMADMYQQDGDDYWAYYWWPQIRRSVMADDYVYAISDAGLRVANVASLDQPIATVKFPAPPSVTP